MARIEADIANVKRLMKRVPTGSVDLTDLQSALAELESEQLRLKDELD